MGRESRGAEPAFGVLRGSSRGWPGWTCLVTAQSGGEEGHALGDLGVEDEGVDDGHGNECGTGGRRVWKRVENNGERERDGVDKTRVAAEIEEPQRDAAIR
jgi:hypothetical protein